MEMSRLKGFERAVQSPRPGACDTEDIDEDEELDDEDWDDGDWDEDEDWDDD
jgi:hypothetical protein